MVRVVLGNFGVAVACAALAGMVGSHQPLAAALPFALAPSAAAALGALLLGGWRLLPGVLLGVFAAVLALRPGEPALAAGLAGTVAASAQWSALYTTMAVGGRLPDLVRTVPGVAALLGLAVGTFAIWHGTLATLVDIILGGAAKTAAAFQASLIGWSVAAAVAALVLLPPLTLLPCWTASGADAPARRRLWTALGVGVGVALASGLLFGADPGDTDLAAALPALTLPLLIGVAAWSCSATAVATSLAGAVALGLTLAGLTSWGTPAGPADLGPVAIMIAAMAVTALPFAALMRKRRRAVSDLRNTNAALEARVAALTTEVRNGEARLRTILESSSVPVAVTRPCGTLVFANGAFRSLFGLTPDPSETLDVTSLFADPAARQTVLDRLRTDGAAVDMEVRYRYADGRLGRALEHAVLTDFEGAPAVLSWLVDITRRKQAEAVVGFPADRVSAPQPLPLAERA